MQEQIIYLNGQFLPKDKAHISPQERGMLFGDGVYEVTTYSGGKPFAMDRHLRRLQRSLKGIHLDSGVDIAKLEQISNELVKKNNLTEANVYWQITRGANSPRNHTFPENVEPTILLIANPAKKSQERKDKPNEIYAITTEDNRWRDCWIKSLMLLPNVMAKQKALQQGCQEAIFHRDGAVKEGTSANLFILQDGALYTHPTDGTILGGITRELLIELAKESGIKIYEKPFSIEQMLEADEVFICGTTTNITAVTKIDTKQINNGKAQAITCALYNKLMDKITE